METKVNKEEKKEKNEKERETSIKGTLISVGLVGSVIFIMYLIVYGLYMARV